MVESDILAALREAYQRAGTQGGLARMAGVSQGRIADYLNERCSIGNMTISVFLRLFPNVAIDFFGGRSANPVNDLLQEQLLEIFDSLDDRSKVRLIAMAAANFGDKIREETRK